MRRVQRTRLSDSDLELLDYIVATGKSVFSVMDLRQQKFKYLADTISILLKKKRISQLERGKYILSSSEFDSRIVGCFLAHPSSIAYCSALNYYDLTEQIPNTIFVQTTKRKTSKQVQNVSFKFISIAPHKFFGFRKEWVGSNSFLITDLEKTILDCFDLPAYAGGFSEAVKGLSKAYEHLNQDTLISYAIQMKNYSLLKRIGYLAEIFKFKNYDYFIAQALKYLNEKYSVLDPLASNKEIHVRKWRLLINHSETELRAMAGTANDND